MDNPAFFTVLSRSGRGWVLTDAGLFGSLAAARDDAGKRRANAPELGCAVAVVSMLEQDPATGTPMGHIAPNATGYALASLSVADTARRSIGHTLHRDLPTARAFATASRARNKARHNGAVADLVALTVVTDPGPEN